MAVHVRDHFARNVSFALGRKPTHDVALEPTLGEHFPECRTFAGRRRDRNDSTGLRVDFGEAWDTVVISHFARGDRGPEHGRELWLEGRQIATGA